MSESGIYDKIRSKTYFFKSPCISKFCCCIVWLGKALAAAGGGGGGGMS